MGRLADGHLSLGRCSIWDFRSGDFTEDQNPRAAGLAARRLLEKVSKDVSHDVDHLALQVAYQYGNIEETSGKVNLTTVGPSAK
jgi:hypothetical protein